uniref:RING-CH-type domain-containing protein n=1 Tax=Kalanchoe fedtschenkoi TaxID=63787 RepID=A0A7N0T6S7_KALFE
MAATADKTHFDLELGDSRNSAAAAGDSRINEVLESGAEIVRVPEKKSGGGGGGEVEVGGSLALDLENGVPKLERDCRICHLSLESSDQTDSDVAIVLGCSCKDDLAAAHKQCAEAWFKIKGNRTCEICRAVARNVAGPTELESTEHWSESNDATLPPQSAPHSTETQNFWLGHRFLNFLLACMVFAFVISWLFHFNIHLRET